LASACLVSGATFSMYAFGGRDDSGGRSDMFVYDNVTQTWREVYAAGDVPATSAAVMGVINAGDLAVFGGVQDGKLSNSAFLFTAATTTWSELPPSSPRPVSRKRMASWVVGARHLLTFAGASERHLLNDVWALDTQTGAWVLWHDGSSSAAPSPRFDPCCGAIPNTNDTLCFGGTDADGDRNDYWRFSNAAMTWTLVNSGGGTGFPRPRRLAHCGFVNDRDFAVWGGWDSDKGEFVGEAVLSLFRPGDGANGTVRNVALPERLDARDSGTMCAAGGHAHLVGGAVDGGPTNEHLQIANERLVVVTPLAERPEQRAGHAAVTVGTDIFIFFGRNSGAFLNDVWRFDTANKTWAKAAIEAFGPRAAPVTRPVARTGACAASRGAVIFVYGGVDANGDRLADLWTFNTVSFAWALQATSGPSPGARDSHGCAVVANRFIVGMGATAALSDSWYGYNFLYQRWSAMRPTGALPAARRSFVLQAIDETTFHVGLGFGTSTFLDWYIMSNVSAPASTDEPLRPVFAKTVSAAPAGHADRRYARGEAATAGAGSRVIVCGGAISPSFPVATRHACYQYDANVATVADMGAATQMPISVSGASGTYLRKRFYVFGGRLSSDNLKLDTYVSALQIFDVDGSAMCLAGSADDASCLHCSPGSLNQASATPADACALVGSGRYSRAAHSAPLQCAVGHSQAQLGATSHHYCIRCPDGTYAAEQGSSACTACTVAAACRLGSTRDATTALEDAPSEAVVQQPRALRPLDWPQLILICVFCSIALIAIGTTTAARAGLLNLRTWDRYTGQHTGLSDDSGPLLKIQTNAGGFFSLVAYCAVLILLSLLLLEFFYNTVSETKSDVPLPVLQSMFDNTSISNDMMFVASVHGPTRRLEGDGVNDPAAASLGGDVASACVVNGTEDTCVGVARWVTRGEYQLPKHVGGFVTDCAVEGRACTMRVHLTAVTLYRHETAALEFLFAAPLSAEEIRTHVVTKTGILKREVNDFGHVSLFTDDEHVSAHEVNVVPLGQSVFSGYPASTVSLQMTPTYYVTPTSLVSWPSKVASVETISATGYHTTATALPVRGHAVDHLLFDQYFGVPVVFELFAGDASLLVTRTYRQSVVELLAEILGSVTGLFGVFLSFVKLCDKYMLKKHGKHYVAGLKKKQNESNAKQKSGLSQKLDGLPFCLVKPVEGDDDEPGYSDAAAPAAAAALPATAAQSAPAAGDRSPSPPAPVTNNDPYDDGAEAPLELDQTCVEVPRSVSRSATVTPEQLLEPEAFARA
jgi:hypothetical protein